MTRCLCVALVLLTVGGTRAGEKEIEAKLKKKLGACVFWEYRPTGTEPQPRIVLVGLARTQVGDADLTELCGLGELETLVLNNTTVTDTGMRVVGQLQRLRELRLLNVAVTDRGLKELAGLRSLRRLDLTDTNVTDAGVAELQKALPNCEIRR